MNYLQTFRYNRSIYFYPLFIEMSIPNQESEQSYICVLRESMFPSSTVFFFSQNCSYNVILIVFHIITYIHRERGIWSSSSTKSFIIYVPVSRHSSTTQISLSLMRNPKTICEKKKKLTVPLRSSRLKKHQSRFACTFHKTNAVVDS